MVSDMGAMFSCIFNLCDVRMRIALTCFVKQGSPLKEVGFWGGGGGDQGEVGKGKVKWTEKVVKK